MVNPLNSRLSWNHATHGKLDGTVGENGWRESRGFADPDDLIRSTLEVFHYVMSSNN